MNIKKFTLVSNNICYGPEPKSGEEIKQRLTVNANGQVWFRGYQYCNGSYIVIRRDKLKIPKQRAEHILYQLSLYLENDDNIIDATDIGDWLLQTIDEENRIQKRCGPLLGNVCVGSVDLTRVIRNTIPIRNLFVFDSPLTNEQKIERLEELFNPTETLVDFYTEILDEVGALKYDYYDYLVSDPIDISSELCRIPTADFDLCGALITMLLREDHFSNGSFEDRFESGQVKPVIKRMIDLLSKEL